MTRQFPVWSVDDNTPCFNIFIIYWFIIYYMFCIGNIIIYCFHMNVNNILNSKFSNIFHFVCNWFGVRYVSFIIVLFVKTINYEPLVQ